MAQTIEAVPQTVRRTETHPSKPNESYSFGSRVRNLRNSGKAAILSAFLGAAVISCGGGNERINVPSTQDAGTPGVKVVQMTPTGAPIETATITDFLTPTAKPTETITAQPTQTPEATATPEAITRKNIEVYADPSIPSGVKNRITGHTLEESIAAIRAVTDQLPNLGNNRKIKIVPGQVLGVDPEDPTQALIGIDFAPSIQAFMAGHEGEHIDGAAIYSGDTKTLADRAKYETPEQIQEATRLFKVALSSPEGRQYPILSKMLTKSKSIAPLVGTVKFSREQLLDWMGQYSDNMWLQTGTVHYTGMSEGKNIENTNDASYNIPVTYGILVPETFKKIDELAKTADTNTIMPYKDLPDFLQKNEKLINDEIVNNPQIPAAERAITKKSFELLKAQQNLFTWENIFAYPDLYGKYDAGWKSALKSYLQLAFEEKYVEGNQSVISLISQDKLETYDNAVNTKLSMADTELLAQWHATVLAFHIEGTAIDPYLNYQQQISTGQIVKLQ